MSLQDARRDDRAAVAQGRRGRRPVCRAEMMSPYHGGCASLLFRANRLLDPAKLGNGSGEVVASKETDRAGRGQADSRRSRFTRSPQDTEEMGVSFKQFLHMAAS
jgi:hypothetical protein